MLAVALPLLVIATIRLGLWAWGSSKDFSVQIAALAMVFTGAGLAIAVLAGIVALAAYWLAIQRPKLGVEISFPNGEGVTIQVRLWNRNSYSARNPAVRIEFFGLQPVHSGAFAWPEVPVTQEGAVGAIQWDGGADYSIHGPDWFRDLPPFQLGAPRVLPVAQPSIYVEAVADGHRTHATADIPH